MPRHLKSAQPKSKQSNDAVRQTVERMLTEIAEAGDEAVRRYARELDKWDGSFKVARETIEAVSQRMPTTFKEDFAYSYRQVTEFAKRQRDSLSEFEVELQPGIRLGQRLIPVSKVGCYIPGGKYPLVAAAIMSIGTARTAGVDHIVGCAPPRDKDGIYAPHALRNACGRGRRDLSCWAASKRWRRWPSGASASRRSTSSPGPATPMWRRLSGSSSAASGST